MKIKLVFCDWRKCGKSIYNTEEGVFLSLGQFHSGTTFDGKIFLSSEDEKELRGSIKEGYEPIFTIDICGDKDGK